MSSQSFADLGVSNPVVSALAQRGVTRPFPVQRLVVPDVLVGRDVLVKSPTGSGKTLAFGLPIVDRLAATATRPAALVLAPTRELAAQIEDDLHDVAHARALAVTAVFGGKGIERQTRLVRRSHILVATPGRLEDLIERGAVTLARVRILVLDEADRMLDMGFRPAVDRIVAQTPADRQTLFFSATLEGEAGRIAQTYTRDARFHDHAPRERKAAVEHRFVAVRHENKVDELVSELRRDDRGRTLVFVRTKRGADRLVKRLRGQSIDAVAMHGDKTQGQRERALARFEDGVVGALVATDVAARGLDIDDITRVINFDAPADREGYVHRVGRTGRAGRTGAGLTFVSADQATDVGRIARDLDLHAEFAHTGYASTPTRPAGPRGGRRNGRSGRRRARRAAR
jgi:superfamily II DNA/RNA helicase